MQKDYLNNKNRKKFCFLGLFNIGDDKNENQ